MNPVKPHGGRWPKDILRTEKLSDSFEVVCIAAI